MQGGASRDSCRGSRVLPHQVPHYPRYTPCCHWYDLRRSEDLVVRNYAAGVTDGQFLNEELREYLKTNASSSSHIVLCYKLTQT